MKILRCNDNKLTKLPDVLLCSLTELDCSNNQLTTLPDNLPYSLVWINLCGNPLLTDKYPKIFDIRSTDTPRIIGYIRECNADLQIEDAQTPINVNKNTLAVSDKIKDEVSIMKYLIYCNLEHEACEACEEN